MKKWELAFVTKRKTTHHFDENDKNDKPDGRSNVSEYVNKHKQMIPYHNPSYPFHGTVIEMIMYCVKLVHVTSGINLKK